ncbi:MAG: hypothetical protein IPO92_04350 [Saprospiraceae bacterium]|nr:hypothetical protein [Saprospiraceae bacterium]
MLSRRNVRVKVMQVLYAQNRDESLTFDATVKEYWKKIDDSFELLLFSLYNLIQITKTASDDFEKRKAKHLPTEIDKLFTPKLWTNQMIQGLVKNKLLIKKFEKSDFAQRVDKDHFRTIYFEFVKEEPYNIFYLKIQTMMKILKCCWNYLGSAEKANCLMKLLRISLPIGKTINH